MEVKVKLEVEGLHRWEECPIEEVSYLRNDHRHIFGVIAHKLITHDKRDIEFIQLKHSIEQYLRNKYWNDTFKCLYFANKSCEVIARELILEFKLSYCEVNEDWENGAILRMQDVGPNVWLISGRICSGKSTVAKAIKENSSLHRIIEVGDLVREITKSEERIHDSSLDKLLIDKIKSELDLDCNVILVGIRQQSILEAVLEYCMEKDRTILPQWIGISEDERRKRYENRSAEKDILTFDEYESMEDELGIETVRDSMLQLINALR